MLIRISVPVSASDSVDKICRSILGPAEELGHTPTDSTSPIDRVRDDMSGPHDDWRGFDAEARERTKKPSKQRNRDRATEQRRRPDSPVAQQNYKRRRNYVIPFVTKYSFVGDGPITSISSTGLVAPHVKGVESTCTPSERSKCSAAQINRERDSYESPSIACISLSGAGIDRSTGEPSDLRTESTVESSR